MNLHSIRRASKVNRHTGGLENLPLKMQSTNWVNRHTGGLEIAHLALARF